MRKTHLLLLATVLISLPVLTSCDVFNLGGKSAAQKEYERQVEILKQQQEANQKAQDEWYRQQQAAIEKYLAEYAEWEKAQRETLLQQLKETP